MSVVNLFQIFGKSNSKFSVALFFFFFAYYFLVLMLFRCFFSAIRRLYWRFKGIDVWTLRRILRYYGDFLDILCLYLSSYVLLIVFVTKQKEIAAKWRWPINVAFDNLVGRRSSVNIIVKGNYICWTFIAIILLFLHSIHFFSHII